MYSPGNMHTGHLNPGGFVLKNVKRQGKTWRGNETAPGEQARNHDLRKGVFLFRKQMYDSRAHFRGSPGPGVPLLCQNPVDPRKAGF